jgi:hypothetical protein
MPRASDGLAGEGLEFGKGSGVVGRTDHGAAGHDELCAGGGGGADRLGRNTAVHAEPKLAARLAADGGESGEFGKRLRLERLSAEAGLDAHHEDAVAGIEVGLDPGHRRGRADGQVGAGAGGANRLQGPAGVAQGLDVNGHNLGSEPAILLERLLGLLDHQVHLERHGRRLPHRLDHNRPVCELRHEAAVHHVEMQSLGPGLLEPLHLAGQVAEIAEEQRGKDDGPVRLEDGGHPSEGGIDGGAWRACVLSHKPPRRCRPPETRV